MTWTDQADKKKTEYPLGPAVEKLMMQVDERIAFEQSGIATKKLSTLNVQKHLDSFNLESQFGTYSKIHALSGGQKVTVVLAAAMWMEPHVLILDEPTNFLDRDSLGALATAIKSYLGGVIIISHQREFYSALCPEVWSVVDGRCTVSGAEWMDAAEKARKRDEKEAKKNKGLDEEDKFAAFGNKIEAKTAAPKATCTPCSSRRGSTPTAWIAAAGSRCCSLLRRAARRPLIRAIASGLGARPTRARRLQTTGARAGSYAAVTSQPSRACSIGCLARRRNSERRSEQRSGARDIGRSTVQ